MKSKGLPRREKILAILQTSAVLAIPIVLVAALAAGVWGVSLYSALIGVALGYCLIALPLAWVAVGVVEILSAAEQAELEDLESQSN